MQAQNSQKLCECGCGELAPLAKGTDKRRGHVKGQSLRFIHGHNALKRGRTAKLCPRCGEEKPVSEFIQKANALDSYCRPCAVVYKREWSERNPEKAAAGWRRYREKNPGPSPAKRKWDEEHNDAIRAHQRVRYALKSGKLTKPDVCERCQKPKKLVAHHDDYTKPLVVRWLCHSCHRFVHAELDGSPLLT